MIVLLCRSTEEQLVRKTKAEAEMTRLAIIDAARAVFYARGVSHTSLEEVARAAGVTRGAVYWHFHGKTDLFYAMREQGRQPFKVVIDSELADLSIADPLAAIERALGTMIDLLRNDAKVRQTLEIMVMRCEYVDEFAHVLQCLSDSHEDLLQKLRGQYARAAELGQLNPRLEPVALAMETLLFLLGMVHRWLGDKASRDSAIWAEAISAHVLSKRAA